MRFYCPIEANPGPGPQKTVDNFMSINSIWSKESLIITWGCSARVFLPESLGRGPGSEHPSKTHQMNWGLWVTQGGCVERHRGAQHLSTLPGQQAHRSI